MQFIDHIFDAWSNGLKKIIILLNSYWCSQIVVNKYNISILKIKWGPGRMMQEIFNEIYHEQSHILELIIYDLC